MKNKSTINLLAASFILALTLNSYSLVNVSKPYSSGIIEITFWTGEINFSNGAQLVVEKPDQSDVTNGGSGFFVIALSDTTSKISYIDSELDSVLFFRSSKVTYIDTIKVIPAHPYAYYNSYDVEVIPIYTEGFDKVFYIYREGENSIRCRLEENSDEPYRTKLNWETDSLGNKIFKSEIVLKKHFQKHTKTSFTTNQKNIYTINGRLIKKGSNLNCGPISFIDISSGIYILNYTNDHKHNNSKVIIK